MVPLSTIFSSAVHSSKPACTTLIILLLTIRLGPIHATSKEQAFTEEDLKVISVDEAAPTYLEELSSLNRGLHTGCYTYSTRYNVSRDETLLRQTGGPNYGHPNSKYVILLKFHFMPSLPNDMVISLQAMAAEAYESGYHFYILYQHVPEAHDQVHGPMTRMDMLSVLPVNLHEYIVFHNFGDTLRAYPNLYMQNEGGWGPGPKAAYLAGTYFMHSHPGYKFAWVVEYDNRLIGHWGKFFNSALQLAIEADPQIPPTTPVAGKSLMSVELPAPEQELRLPALLSFGSIYNSTLWNDTQKGGWNLSELCDTPLMVYGASRPLFQAMHKYSLEGIGSYQATFPPTVAFSEGLKMVSIELPHRRESHHSGAKDAKLLYRRFYEQERCTNSVLLHPIKLDEDFWPKVDRTHGFLPRTSRGKL